MAISSRAPNSILAASRRLDVGAEQPVALAVGDRLADQPEVVAQQRRGKALHELRRLPQLDLKDDREVAIGAEAGEVAAGQAAQPLGRIAQIGDRGAAGLQTLAHAALEDRDEQVVFAFEVEIDRAGGDAGGAGDVGDLGVEEAALGEDVDGGAEDGVAFGPGGASRRGARRRCSGMTE